LIANEALYIACMGVIAINKKQYGTPEVTGSHSDHIYLHESLLDCAELCRKLLRSY
jgi:hypothetical protein